MQKLVVQDESVKQDSASVPLLAIVSVMSTVCMLGWLLWYCQYGFDFTDESFYLNWMSRPFNYSASSTQFGFLYHPLYKLVGGDIASLRQINVVFSFFLGWASGWLLLSRLFGARTIEFTLKLAISLGIATSSLMPLVFAGMWLPTPSYNSLTFQGILVVVIGLLLAEKTVVRASIAGWVLIGVGGWMVFMGKPTSAGALALIAAFYLLLTGKVRFRLLAIAVGVAVGLILASAFAMDGSLIEFAQRLREGAGAPKLLDSSYTVDRIFRLDELLLDENTKIFLFLVAGIIFCATWLGKIDFAGYPRGKGLVSAGCVFFGLLVAFRFFPLEVVPGKYRGLLLYAAPFGAAAAGFSVFRLKGLLKIRWSHWISFLSFLALPYAYAFGTENNYWIPISSAGIFIVFAGIYLLGPIASYVKLPGILFSLSLSIQMISGALINQGLLSPYRQLAPLRQNDSAIDVGKPGATLVLAKKSARYLATAKDIVAQSGFEPGSPMIDLSGHSPGMVYALGANAVGMAWALGGYPGSNRFTVEGLKHVPCRQLAVAWFLTEPQGPQAISSGILSSFGAELSGDFRIVGTLMSPEGQIQYFYKPIRDVDAASAACEAARGVDS